MINLLEEQRQALHENKHHFQINIKMLISQQISNQFETGQLCEVQQATLQLSLKRFKAIIKTKIANTKSIELTRT